jgi:SAM-dependent methyltransferase
MPDSRSPAPAPDYGLDAPGAVRNLFIAAGAGLLIRLTIVAHLWSGVLTLGPLSLPLGRMSVGVTLGCGFMGAWMAWDSKIGKVRERERLLDMLAWTGRERVLDVGCGRGLLLVGAAKRLTTGSAAGIDLWQLEDLSGNRPEATLENARLEGVAERVEVHTADMREIPFPDASFDTVLSMNAIHNVYSAPGRAAAIAEITRVLKPGGAVLIVDVRHIREYAAALRAGGCTNVRRVGSDFGTILCMILSVGAVRPGNLIARKDG